MVSVADCVPPVMVNVQWPAAIGVTVNVPPPLAGAIDAIPTHEPVLPEAAVVAVNEPAKPGSVAVNVCAAPLPAAENDSEDGVSAIVPGEALGPGVGDAVGVAVGVADAVGTAVGDGEAVGDTVGPGDAVGNGGAVLAVPPDPLHAGTPHSTATVPSNTKPDRVTRLLRTTPSSARNSRAEDHATRAGRACAWGETLP